MTFYESAKYWVWEDSNCQSWHNLQLHTLLWGVRENSNYLGEEKLIVKIGGKGYGPILKLNFGHRMENFHRFYLRPMWTLKFSRNNETAILASNPKCLHSIHLSLPLPLSWKIYVQYRNFETLKLKLQKILVHKSLRSPISAVTNCTYLTSNIEFQKFSMLWIFPAKLLLLPKRGDIQRFFSKLPYN